MDLIEKAVEAVWQGYHVCSWSVVNDDCRPECPREDDRDAIAGDVTQALQVLAADGPVAVMPGGRVAGLTEETDELDGEIRYRLADPEGDE